MKFSVTSNFFYFYYLRKLEKIKKKVLKEEISEKVKNRKDLSWFLKKAGQAAIVTLFLYQVFFYLNIGRFLSPREFSGDPILQFEIVSNFLYIYSIFLIFPFISSFVARKIRLKNTFIKGSIELVLVFLTNAVLLSLITLAPLFLFFPTISPMPGRIRTAYLITGIFSLFFYFFVEREHSKQMLHQDVIRTAKLQKNNLQAQLESLKNQVNPHFLFNSLNVLNSLIQQDQSQAIEFTRRLGQIYRSFMENSRTHLISLDKELEVARAYIYLLETRFGTSVQFDIKVPLAKLDLEIPTGCLQMLLENAIKHNGSTKKKPLHVLITSEENYLLVKNNLQPRLETFESTRTGLSNIKNRYLYLSEERPIFKKTDTEFIAKLPLLNPLNHEDPDY